MPDPVTVPLSGSGLPTQLVRGAARRRHVVARAGGAHGLPRGHPPRARLGARARRRRRGGAHRRGALGRRRHPSGAVGAAGVDAAPAAGRHRRADERRRPDRCRCRAWVRCSRSTRGRRTTPTCCRTRRWRTPPSRAAWSRSTSRARSPWSASRGPRSCDPRSASTPPGVAGRRRRRRVAVGGAARCRPARRRAATSARICRRRRGTAWAPSGSSTAGAGSSACATASPRVVPVMGLPKGVREVDLTAVAVSRDGTRMALLVRRGTRVEPLVARLENTARERAGLGAAAHRVGHHRGGRPRLAGRRHARSSSAARAPRRSRSWRWAWAPPACAAQALRRARSRSPRARVARPSSAPAQDLYRNGGSTWTRLAAGTDPTYPG